MATEQRSVLRRLISTESEWNPKVILGRVILPLLPEPVLHRLKKSYYAFLLTRTPETWIERDAFIAQHFISPGDVVLDIGANLGVFTRFLSRCVGPNGKVYSFEPIPQTFEFLTNNIRKLRLPNVEALNFAASDSERSDTMVIPTYRWGSECWYDARIKTEKSDPSWRTMEVKSRSLDNFFAEKPPSSAISFIKCDANYHELAVLRGAFQTIETFRPAMLIEVNPDPDDPTTTAYATFDLLRRTGYEIFLFDGARLAQRKPGQRSQNYFFLTAQQVKRLDAEGTAFPKSA
jgi:FkbM family methyltransferase